MNRLLALVLSMCMLAVSDCALQNEPTDNGDEIVYNIADEQQNPTLTYMGQASMRRAGRGIDY